MSTKTMFSIAAAVFCLLSAIFAATHDFIPDFTFKGSSLTGWHEFGNANWRAENGEIVGHSSSAGRRLAGARQGLSGYRILYGIPLRGEMRRGRAAAREKTPDGGWKGVYVSLDGEPGPYEVTLNAEGKELSRTPCRERRRSSREWPPAHGQTDMLTCRASRGPRSRSPNNRKKPPKPPAAPAGARPRRRRPPQRGRGGFAPPRAEIKAGEWNTLDVIVDTDMVWTALNGRRGGNSATGDRMMGYGPVLLHAGGRARSGSRTSPSRT